MGFFISYKNQNVRTMLRRCILIGCLLTAFGCATIPKQAPMLSEELGTKLGSLEQANLELIHSFFNQKRLVVDQFIDEEWLPLFASNFFREPSMANVWEQIAASGNAEDRLKYLVLVGPKLQAKINEKRQQLIRPLDSLEREIELRMKNEYAMAREMNNTLTSFLYSAAKVQEIQQKYLHKVGLTDEKIGDAIDQTDRIVGALADKAGDSEEEIQAYLDRARSILGMLKKKQ
jgi:hypothetical protein